MLIILLCVVILFSCTACNTNVKFSEGENDTIISAEGIEYIRLPYDSLACPLGKQEFIGHVKGEKKSFVHLTSKIKTGMYSYGGDYDVLGRIFPDNEFTCIYVKSGLLKTEISPDNCMKFEFAKDSPVNISDITNSKNGIQNCEEFLNDIRSGQTAKEAGLYDLVTQPNGYYKNLYYYGYIYGVLQKNLNLVIPLRIMSFDNKAYSIFLDDKEYVFPEKWVKTLIGE